MTDAANNATPATETPSAAVIERAATGSETVETMSEAMGLELCEFGGSCDFCEPPPEAKTWVSMFIAEGVCEASYYVCDKCLPKKYAEHVAQLEAMEEAWHEDESPNDES